MTSSDSPEHFPVTDDTKLHRLPARGSYDRDVVYAILDEAIHCHVGFVDNGRPLVIPTIHVRVDDRLYLHGSTRSRMLRCAGSGAPVCVTVTLLDGLVLARSAFHHSVNYRSAVILGGGEAVTDPQEKNAVLQRFTEHVIPGRWEQVRAPSAIELKQTAVVGIPINEVSAKVRTGPPVDDEEDMSLPVWAGVLPLQIGAGIPQPAADMQTDVAVPSHVRDWNRSTKT